MLKRAISLGSRTLIITGLGFGGPDLTVTAKGCRSRSSFAVGSYAAFKQSAGR